MKNRISKNNAEKVLTILYFLVATVEITLEFCKNKSSLFVVKPLVYIVLVLLYWVASTQRNFLFFVSILFLLIVKLSRIYINEDLLFIGMIFFFLHRLVLIYYVSKLIQLKDYFPLFIATIPFLFFFFYLLSITSDIELIMYLGLIIQCVLMSLVAGIALSHYVMNDRKEVWLLIFGLLSVVQYFIIFIDNFYLVDSSPSILRKLGVLLTTFATYAFYKFVITTERKLTQ
jgi:hypothetical protein